MGFGAFSLDQSILQSSRLFPEQCMFFTACHHRKKLIALPVHPMGGVCGWCSSAVEFRSVHATMCLSSMPSVAGLWYQDM